MWTQWLRLPENGWPTQQYTYPTGLDPVTPNTPLDEDEMRITFLGSTFPPSRRAQQMMSIFVEVGPWIQNPNGSTGGPGQAADSFIFDCGAGVVTNYKAMQIGYGRMDKLFITHLHADHMNDLSSIYSFGPSEDRKWPLYVWGHGPSGVKARTPPRRLYDDGTKAFCQHLREAMRWHTESFSFLPTSWASTPFPPGKAGDCPAIRSRWATMRRTTGMASSRSSSTGRSPVRCRETTSRTTIRQRG